MIQVPTLTQIDAELQTGKQYQAQLKSMRSEIEASTEASASQKKRALAQLDAQEKQLSKYMQFLTDLRKAVVEKGPEGGKAFLQEYHAKREAEPEQPEEQNPDLMPSKEEIDAEEKNVNQYLAQLAEMKKKVQAGEKGTEGQQHTQAGSAASGESLKTQRRQSSDARPQLLELQLLQQS